MKDFLARTAWFRKAGYGFFFHFLNGTAGGGSDANRSPETWNKLCNAYDVEKVARQLHNLGAGYCFITVGQNSGYYCAPNKTYDAFLGYTAENSTCSRRDLISDFSDALAKYDIPLLIYTTSFAPASDVKAILALGCVPPWDTKAAGPLFRTLPPVEDSRLRSFQKKWEAIHREWAERWGTKIKGWWIDGCYYPQRMYDFPDEPNGNSFARALRSGNPDALIGMNRGVIYPSPQVQECEDYTAGETNEPWKNIWHGPEIGGAQYHILTYAGKTWKTPPLMYSPNELAAITKSVLDHCGVITWDVPFDAQDGTMLPEFYEAFLAMKNILKSSHTENQSFSLDNMEKPVEGKKAGTAILRTDKTTPIELIFADGKQTLEGKEEYVLHPSAEKLLSKGSKRILTIRYGDFERVFEVPCQFRYDLARENLSSDFLSSSNEKLGTISVEYKENGLHITADAAEPVPNIARIPWQGSGLELFFAEKGKKETILQLFVLPEGRILYDDGTGYVPYPDAKLSVQRDSAGYHSEITISKDVLPAYPDVLFTANLTVNRGNHFVNGVLFGGNGREDLGQYGQLHLP